MTRPTTRSPSLLDEEAAAAAADEDEDESAGLAAEVELDEAVDLSAAGAAALRDGAPIALIAAANVAVAASLLHFCDSMCYVQFDDLKFF